MRFLPNSVDHQVIHSSPTKNMGVAVLCSFAIVLSGCALKDKKRPNSNTKTTGIAKGIPHINDKTKFSSKVFGVKGSPRVSTAKKVRKGGGRYQVGKPYTIRGKRYYPKEDKNLKQVGMASWYGPNFHGRLTANGEVYDQYSLSAAHPTMPLPSYAKVTNLENGRYVTVRVNDRGPYAHGRVIDLSAQAAKMLDYTQKGVAKVKVEYIGKARMDGLDGDVLMASYSGENGRGGKRLKGTPVDVPETLVAMNAPSADIGSTASVAAIGESFSQTNPIPISSVPVPTNRPTIFVPVEEDGEVIYQVRRQPLAYVAEQEILTFAQFAKVNSSDYRQSKLFAKDKVTLNLGLFNDEITRHALGNLFVGAGKLHFAGSLATIIVPQQQANIVFDYSKSIGLDTVSIR